MCVLGGSITTLLLVANVPVKEIYNIWVCPLQDFCTTCNQGFWSFTLKILKKAINKILYTNCTVQYTVLYNILYCTIYCTVQYTVLYNILYCK